MGKVDDIRRQREEAARRRERGTVDVTGRSKEDKLKALREAERVLDEDVVVKDRTGVVPRPADPASPGTPRRKRPLRGTRGSR